MVHPVPRLTLLFFNAAKAPEAAETATSRTNHLPGFTARTGPKYRETLSEPGGARLF